MAKKIKGITIQLGGDTSGLTKALADADKSLSATQREINAVQKALKLDPSNVALMAQKQELLTEAIKTTSDKLKELEANQEKAKRAFEANEEWERQYKPLKEKIDAAKKSLSALKEEQEKAQKDFESGKISAEDFEKIKAKTGEAKTALDTLEAEKKKLNEQFQNGHITGEEYREYIREVERTRGQLQNLQGELRNTGVTSEEVRTKFTTLGEHAKEDFTKIVKAAAAVTAALIAIGKKAVEAGAQFDESMSGVAATMGYSVEELNTEGSEAQQTMQKLRDTALALGKSTSKSANEASQALNYMALAGYDAETAISMLPKVLDLSSAAEIDLAKASDMVTDAQSALGLSIEDTETLINQMAKTASKSNTSVEQLGEGILTIGATAKDIKGGTQELTQVLGLLADNGIKGAEGGTKLRNILLKLEAPTQKAADKLEELGVSAYDSNGKLRSMQDIFTDLNAAMEGMTEQDKSLAKATIFNARDLGAVNALLNTTSDRWNELGAAIEDSAGAAHEMADVKLDNLAGDITLFKSAVEGAQITVSDRLTPALRDMVQFGTEAVGKLADGFGQGGLSGAVAAAHKIIAQDLEEQKNLIFGIETVITGAVGAWITYKSVALFTETVDALKLMHGYIVKNTEATEALNATQAANPLALIAALAVGAGIAISKLIDIQTDLIDETIDGYELLDDKQKEVVDNAESVIKQINESKKSWTENKKALETQAEGYRGLAKELYKLDSQQQIGNKDRAAMKAIVNELNKSISGLNIELDEQTGHLKTQRSVIDELITKYEEQAKAAAAQERLTELFKEQYAAEKKIKDIAAEREKAYQALAPLTEELAEKQKALDEFAANHNSLQIWGKETEEEYRALTQAVDDATDAVNAQKDRIGDLNGAFVDTSTALRGVNDDIDDTENLIGNLTEEMGDTADTFSEDAGKIGDSAEKMGQSIAEGFDIEEEVNAAVSKIEEIIKAYDDKLASRTGTLQSWFDVNATISGDDAKFGNLSRTLDQQIKDMEKWAADIDKLEKEGINQNFLDKLKDAGPQSQALVSELLTVPADKRNEYADKWYEAYSGAATIAEQQLSAMKAENERQINEMIADLSAKSPEFEAAWKNLGLDAIDGYIEGLRDGKKLKELQDAVKEMVDIALEQTAAEQDSASPSKKTKKLGGDFEEGYAVGISDDLTKTAKAAKQMVDKAMGAAESMSSSAGRSTAKSLPTVAAVSTTTTPQTVTASINADELAAATKKALGELLTGGKPGAVYLDGKAVGEIVYPDINQRLGSELTLDTKGYST